MERAQAHNCTRIMPSLLFTENAKKWAAFIALFRDITGPTHLVKLWQSRPSSVFALLLVTMVMGVCSVAAFFHLPSTQIPHM